MRVNLDQSDTFAFGNSLCQASTLTMSIFDQLGDEVLKRARPEEFTLNIDAFSKGLMQSAYLICSELVKERLLQDAPYETPKEFECKDHFGIFELFNLYEFVIKQVY